MIPGTAISAPAMLDIPTQPDELIQSSTVMSPTQPDELKKRQLSESSRRFYGRSILGLQLPGRYYFITWTSSPQSPPIEESWKRLRWWLRRKRPLSCWNMCITREGNGVIHMIIRLGPGEKRLDVKEVRAYWEKMHKAKQIRIDHVEDSKKYDLATYIADQRKKRKLGGELAWQDEIVRWRWSKGWLPKGFTRASGRVWHRLRDLPLAERQKAVNGWLAACHADENNVFNGPGVTPSGEIRWPERKPFEDHSADNDKDLEARLKDPLLYTIQGPDMGDCLPEGPVTLAGWSAMYGARRHRMGVF